MNFVAIGRGEILYAATKLLTEQGHNLVSIVTDTAAPEYRISIQDFKELARVNSVPILVSSRREQITIFLQQFEEIDIGISVNHRNILSADVLQQFKLGVLNLHGGDLPRFKGNACQAWAIINGEERIGACVYRMEPNILDNGKIMSRRYLEINQNTKIQECLSWLETNGPDMFAESLNKLSINSNYFIEDTATSSVVNLRCHERRPEDGYIDWNLEPDEVIRLVNASGHPYFGAFSFLEGELVNILDVALVSIVEPYLAIPGQIVNVCDDYVLVACGEISKKGLAQKSILISEIKFRGQIVKASTILRSTRMRLGSKDRLL